MSHPHGHKESGNWSWSVLVANKIKDTKSTWSRSSSPVSFHGNATLYWLVLDYKWGLWTINKNIPTTSTEDTNKRTEARPKKPFLHDTLKEFGITVGQPILNGQLIWENPWDDYMSHHVNFRPTCIDTVWLNVPPSTEYSAGGLSCSNNGQSAADDNIRNDDSMSSCPRDAHLWKVVATSWWK